MSINFATLKGLTIPEGNVTQIADASGRVLWMLSGGKVILEVEKITSDTYAGETTYTGEQFILLDIYPKTNGTVSVTYGGLTKTITDTSGVAEPNAQQVFFGTFNGVSDSVATPSSGRLTIEGDCVGFGLGKYKKAGTKSGSYSTLTCSCVINILDFGMVTDIPDSAFYFGGLTGEFIIPSTIKRIGNSAFLGCGLTGVTIRDGLSRIGTGAFSGCINLKTVKMLGAVPPEMVVYTNSSGETQYDTFGVAGSSSFYLEQIIVPKGSGNTYKAAEGWSTYADYIVEE